MTWKSGLRVCGLEGSWMAPVGSNLTRLVLLAVIGCLAVPALAKPPKAQPGVKQPALMLNLLLSTNAEPDTGAPPLKVKFTCEVYEGDEAVKPKYEWDFGDGSPKSREQNPTHVYKKLGQYRATVSVKDASGRSGRDDLDIYVEEE